jgi:hypothetical protein
MLVGQYIAWPMLVRQASALRRIRRGRSVRSESVKDESEPESESEW